LVEKYRGGVKWKSLWNETIFDSEYKWRNDIIRHMDNLSCNKFFYELEFPLFCKHCGIRLLESSYCYGGKWKGADKGFHKYCPLCESKCVWKSIIKSSQECENISNGLKKWAKTSEGKNYYKLRGNANSQFMKDFSLSVNGKKIKKQASKKQSITMREKIKNGEFTPNITNSWTHWDAKIKIDGKIKKFRSSWEACFYICNSNLKYEMLRIPYGDKIYIADFYDEKNRILYELKPRASYNTQIKKITEIIEYCKENGIIFKWINENNILKYIDSSKINGYNRKQYNKMMRGLKYV
jgi:hypothetical protein